jgi:dihydroorotase
MGKQPYQTATTTLIQQARVLDPASGMDQIADVRIENGRIGQIGKDLKKTGEETIDAHGLWLFPGLVDLHVHLREPGYEGKETVASGNAGSRRRGRHLAGLHGQHSSSIDNKTGVDFILERVAHSGVVRVYPVGAITKGMEGKELALIGEMVEAGAVAICDEQGIMDSQVILRALEYCTIFGIPILSHAEDLTLSKDGFIHDGEMAIKLGLIGQPEEAESIQIARDLLLAKKPALTYILPISAQPSRSICSASIRRKA